MMTFPLLAKRMVPLVIAAAAVLIGIAPVPATADRAKPNVLLVLTDDIGIDQLTINGYGGKSAPPTPNVESLQRAGLTFANAWSMPACSTARGVLFTGRYPFRTQMQGALGPSDLANSMIAPWENTLPRIMSRAGYATAIFGKFHIGLQGKSPYGIGMPHSLGWDYFNGWLDETGDPSSIDTTAGGVGEPGTYPNGYVPGTKDDSTNGADYGACYQASGRCRFMTSRPLSENPAGRACRDDGGIFVPKSSCKHDGAADLDFQMLSAHYVSPLVINDGDKAFAVPSTAKEARTFRNIQQTDAAISWIRKQQNRGRPWFATVSTATVHTPMQAPPVSTLPDDALDSNGADLGTIGGSFLIANQMIQAMDHELGRLLLSTGLARKSGQRIVSTAALANTVIIYVNDNGSLGSQVRQPFDPYRAKGTPYQTGVWTPMIVAGPIVRTPGRDVHALVNIADLYELIGTLGGMDVRRGNPRIVDSVPMLPYFNNVKLPSIRKYDFTLVGPNLQAGGTLNGPCQFSSSCSQIPVTKGVCEDNGGIWFGKDATGSYPTPNGTQAQTPIPTDGFDSCCQVQVWVKENGGTPLSVQPETGIGVRDTKGFKLVRTQVNDYVPGSGSDPGSCVPSTYNEFYTINQRNPPRLDREKLQLPTPTTGALKRKYDELTAYMDAMLDSEPDCLSKGDGNDDGVVDAEDLSNFASMARLTAGSSWYDVNLDGKTDGDDLSIIELNQNASCN